MPGGSLNTWSDDDPSRGQWWRPLWPRVSPLGSARLTQRPGPIMQGATTSHRPCGQKLATCRTLRPRPPSPFDATHSCLELPRSKRQSGRGEPSHWKSSLHGCTLRRKNAGPQPLKSGIPSHGKNVSTKCWLSHRLTPEHHRADPEHHLSSGSIRRGINRWLRSTASQSRAALPTQSGPLVRRTVWEMALNSTLGTPSGLRVRSTLVPTNNPPEKM